jgi:3'(2'), 5'-bisphosphate nucleotidase
MKSKTPPLDASRPLEEPTFLSVPPLVEAVAGLREAAGLCSRIRADAPFQTKSDSSPVTVADFAVQAVLARRLAQAVPDSVLVAEEDSRSLRGEAGRPMMTEVTRHVRSVFPGATAEDVQRWIDLGRGEPGTDFWTLDPVDGTKGFRRGGQYVIALARILHGRVALAVLACPALRLAVPGLAAEPGVLAVAAHGEGTWACGMSGGSWVRLRASAVDDPKEARCLRSVEGAHTDEDWLSRILSDLGIIPAPARMDSQAKYLVVAAGEADVIFRLVPPADRGHREWVWDQAAAALLVEEAGGRVTDLEGRPLDFDAGRRLDRNFGVLATNGRLHDAALATLRRVLPR